MREQNQNSLQAATRLTPRGGGRGAALFGANLAPQAQIQNLFNPLRSQSATGLASIGQSQVGQGTNLFGQGNQALGAASGASATLGQNGLQSQQMSNQLASGIGSGLFSLLTLPFGGGASANGLLGLLGGGK